MLQKTHWELFQISNREQYLKVHTISEHILVLADYNSRVKWNTRWEWSTPLKEGHTHIFRTSTFDHTFCPIIHLNPAIFFCSKCWHHVSGHNMNLSLLYCSEVLAYLSSLWSAHCSEEMGALAENSCSGCPSSTLYRHTEPSLRPTESTAWVKAQSLIINLAFFPASLLLLFFELWPFPSGLHASAVTTDSEGRMLHTRCHDNRLRTTYKRYMQSNVYMGRCWDAWVWVCGYGCEGVWVMVWGCVGVWVWVDVGGKGRYDWGQP